MANAPFIIRPGPERDARLIWVVEWNDNNGTVRRTPALATQGDAIARAKDIQLYIRDSMFVIRCFAEVADGVFMESTP